MHPANAFWDGRRVTIIDFDEPVYNWIWVDFGRALLDFYRRPPRARRQLHDALLAGYGEIRAIDAELHEQLPRFMQLRGLMMHLWSLADEGTIASGPAPHQRVWALGNWDGSVTSCGDAGQDEVGIGELVVVAVVYVRAAGSSYLHPHTELWHVKTIYYAF